MAEQTRENRGTMVRVPQELADALDALIPLLQKDHEYAAFGQVTRSDVARLAMSKGIASLRGKYTGGSRKNGG